MSITVTHPRLGSSASPRTRYVNLNGSGITPLALVEALTGRKWVELVEKKRGRGAKSVSNSVRVVLKEGVNEVRAEVWLRKVIDTQLSKVAPAKEYINKARMSKLSDLSVAEQLLSCVTLEEDRGHMSVAGDYEDNLKAPIEKDKDLLPAKMYASPAPVDLGRLRGIVSRQEQPNPTATAKTLLKAVLGTKLKKKHMVTIRTPDGVEITIGH